jgi:peptidoglycan biosynthesis protein MviN/MurJ (putative lipid II flippase)
MRRLTTVHPNHRRIANSALLIAALTVIAKLFVTAREIAIAWRYGISDTVDAYQLALTIVTWVPLLLSGTLAVVLVPLLVRQRHRLENRKGFISELNATALLVAVTVALATFVLAPAVARLLASQLDAQTVNVTTSMAERMAPIAFAIIIAGYFTARLQARERFSYTVTEAVPALFIVLLVAGPFYAAGATPLVIGTVVGFGAQLVLLGLLVVRADPPFGGLRIRHESGEWRAIYGAMLMMGAGQLLITAALPVDQLFAARVAEGAVATLGYATRIVTILMGLATVVIGRALLPVLSQAVADGHLGLGRRQALQWSGMMFCAAAVGALALWMLAPELVRLIFERGAFGDRATTEVAAAVRFGAFQLPFYCAGIVLVQWYAANGLFRDLFLMNIAALVLKVAGNAILAPALGVGGIMLSTALMYALTSSLMLLLISRTSPAEPLAKQRSEWDE